MLQLILLSSGLLAIAIAAMSLKILFDKNGKFSATGCNHVGADLKNRGVDSCETNTCNPTPKK